ncbi:MAG: alpha-glucan family phosphorylase [Pseudomonadota bacterium]
MPGTSYYLEVRPQLPDSLARLDELANDLYYSWDPSVRALYARLDPQLWNDCGHTPRVFLRRVAQARLEEAAADRVYMREYTRVLSAYDSYRESARAPQVTEVLDPEHDLIAYSCFEYGIHESFPLYSGGLGVLAGDHCKAASDMGVPFVAIGMLYRLGFFSQEIDAHGNQVARYRPTDYADVPLEICRGDDGRELRTSVSLPGREIALRIWRARCGHISLYLLDTDVEENSEQDRRISYQLYGGDRTTRIQQEIVLGIGGVRAMRALGLAPTVWHINEGHAAFQILERCRERVMGEGLAFDTAIESVAAATVFTTHTPVPAGHDVFDHAMMAEYFEPFAQALGLQLPELLALGQAPNHPNSFNMTALGLRGSRFRNGVSRIHGGVVSEMEQYIWPEVPPEENPIGYVTNGVHLPTFLAEDWSAHFDVMLGGGWRNELSNAEYWSEVPAKIPNHSFWSITQSLKARLLEDMAHRVTVQAKRHGASEPQIARLTAQLRPADRDVLVLGFARRFATYKRATLLLRDLDRLARLLNDEERPVILVFAGKAHPSDMPGQDLIRQVHAISKRPEFLGRLLLLENYDLSLARTLYPGVDVWLNTPEYPMEASGTSGQKAAMNGAVNLSILDGWWGEGYNGENGFAVAAHGPDDDPHTRDAIESQEMLDLLEHRIIPLYFKREEHGYSDDWVAVTKASQASILPRFNAQRMLEDYLRGFYGPAAAQRRRLDGEHFLWARRLAEWRSRIERAWPQVSAMMESAQPSAIGQGETLPLQVSLALGELDASDIVIECVTGVEDANGELQVQASQEFEAAGGGTGGVVTYRLDYRPPLAGLQCYRIRLFPWHPLLTHRFEMGLMRWL